MVQVIATLNEDGTWSVWAGWPAHEDVIEERHEDPDVVYYCRMTQDVTGLLTDGTKLSRMVAEQLFPDWSGIKYK